MNSDTHILYRFFAADDTLLYVGMTRNPARRFEKHSSEKPWWSGVARIEIEHFATRDELKEAERCAIQDEKPVHNIRMNGGGRAEQQQPVSHCGLRVGSVYALGTGDGECPVGIVIGLDDDGVTLALFRWGLGDFSGSKTWVPYAAIKKWVAAEKEAVVPKQRASDGFFYNSDVKELFLMDPLAGFQRRWMKGPSGIPSGKTPEPVPAPDPASLP